MGNVFKLKTFVLQKNYTRYEKNVGNKIIYLKKLYKFTDADYFLIGHVVFVLIA